MYATQTPLYAPKPPNGDTVPALAEGEPQISDDKKSVTVTLKKGVKSGPPVNREVQAKDIKYAFERTATKNVPGEYTNYTTSSRDIRRSRARCKDISGIKIDNPYKITFKLTEPKGVAFAAFLIMPVTSPVPKEYAQKFDKESPTTYGANVVSSGPYMVENDRRARRRLLGGQVDPPRPQPQLGQEHGLPSRLPRRDPDAHELDRRQRGRPPGAPGPEPHPRQQPAGADTQARSSSAAGPARDAPGGGYRWFTLNTTIKPLDDINVRKAILAGFDRDAARKARGGEFVGKIPTHLIPPGIGGFEEAGGARDLASTS